MREPRHIAKDLRYCPKCGATEHRDAMKSIFDDGTALQECPHCRYIVSDVMAPIGCLVVDDGEILSRGNQP
jgi:hypothetical protein